MDANDIKHPVLEECFQVEVKVEAPVVVGQDGLHGRRQIIIMTEGIVKGKLNGRILPGGIDAQIIRPNGLAELSARYAIQLDDGKTVYIENNGIRRVEPAYAAQAAAGKIIDPEFVYFASVPKFEVYDETLKWLEESVFICRAARLPDKVLLRFYRVL
ncbi:MAG: DUF3237 domain-containing protein [Oscillospiraceae bacterium]|nr:DUF3237 domain-containing protein [Oscillospiraceae bacterium]